MRLLSLLFFLVFTPTLLPGHSTVTLTDRVISVKSVDVGKKGRSLGDVKIYTMHLYNKKIQKKAFGNGILRCTFLGKGGVLGGGASECSGTYSLPRGKINVNGIVKSRAFYRLAMTGGTEFYANGQGDLVASTIAVSPRQELLLFRLDAS